MKSLLSASFLLLAANSYAFVSGPSTVNQGENYLALGTQIERGKIEPNENRASFQSALIEVYKLKYIRGYEGLLGLSRSNLYLEYGSFTSKKEEVGATLFYDKDVGNYLTVGFSGDLVHDLEKQFGIYLQASPNRNYNKNKFSNPRIDVFAFGFNSAFNITENLFQKNLLHVGSGDGAEQNSYLAIDVGFGYRLNHLVGRQFTILGSIFIEADTAERKDAKYDAAFSPAGTEDRIRAFKYGTVAGLDVALVDSVNLSANYLQKLGGYDARSTQIYTLNIGYKF